MSVIVTVPAEVLPVSLTMALRMMRLLEQDLDMANLCLQAATDRVEDYTGLSLVTKTFRANFICWNLWKELGRSPTLAVSSVKYYANGEDVLTTLDPGEYIVDTSCKPGRIFFNGANPSLAPRADALQVTFTAGHGTLESAIPAACRVAVIMLARTFYDNPKLMMADGRAMEMPYGVRHMLRSLRVDPTVL